MGGIYGRTRFERELEQLGLGAEYEVLDPGRNTYLDLYLRKEKDWPQWRVLALLDCGAIQIEGAAGRMRKPAKPGEVLKKGEKIRITDPLLAACAQTFTQPQAGRYADYGFAPGPTNYHRALREYMDWRPETIHLKEPADLLSIVRTLTKGEKIEKPPRHIVIGAHAHGTGILGIPMDSAPGTPPNIDLAQLEKAVTSKRVEIPAAVLTPRPKDAGGKQIVPTVHIKGYRIGDNAVFLKALKQALGGKVCVTAPKFFHFFRERTERRSGKLVELWEYMSYDFTVRAAAPLTRDQLIERYVKQNPPFTLVGNSNIAKTTWEQWIPAKGWGTWTPRKGDSPEFRYLEVPVDVVHPVAGTTETLKGVAAVRYVEARVLMIKDIFQTVKDPRTSAGRKAIVRDVFDRDPIESKKHLEKLKLKSVDELMDGDWRFEVPKGQRALAARLVRHEYTVMRPVVDPSTNKLYMNIYQATSKGPPPPRTDRFQLLEKDVRFFGMV